MSARLHINATTGCAQSRILLSKLGPVVRAAHSPEAQVVKCTPVAPHGEYVGVERARALAITAVHVLHQQLFARSTLAQGVKALQARVHRNDAWRCIQPECSRGGVGGLLVQTHNARDLRAASSHVVRVDS